MFFPAVMELAKELDLKPQESMYGKSQCIAMA